MAVLDQKPGSGGQIGGEVGMKMSTCPDSTCIHRDTFGHCTQETCVLSKVKFLEELVGLNCELCKYDLDDGDYLYQRISQDHAIVFEEIVAHYCPACGRKLERR